MEELAYVHGSVADVVKERNHGAEGDHISDQVTVEEEAGDKIMEKHLLEVVFVLVIEHMHDEAFKTISKVDEAKAQDAWSHFDKGEVFGCVDDVAVSS